MAEKLAECATLIDRTLTRRGSSEERVRNRPARRSEYSRYQSRGGRIARSSSRRTQETTASQKTGPCYHSIDTEFMTGLSSFAKPPAQVETVIQAVGSWLEQLQKLKDELEVQQATRMTVKTRPKECQIKSHVQRSSSPVLVMKASAGRSQSKNRRRRQQQSLEMAFLQQRLFHVPVYP